MLIEEKFLFTVLEESITILCMDFAGKHQIPEKPLLNIGEQEAVLVVNVVVTIQCQESQVHM
jgi:hypothetical protein